MAFANDQRLALAALVLAMVFIGVGAGGIKPNAAPWAAEQYQRRDASKISADGEGTVVDYDLNIQKQVSPVHARGCL